MNRNLMVENDHARAEVSELLEHRSEVQEWLERLQEQRGTVSERVLERVRADYEQRLRKTLEALSSHRDSLRVQLEQVTTRLIEAEDRHAQVQDALEEGRLRSAIGELDNEAWSAERIGLESAVDDAAARETAVREESDRLRELLAQLTDEARPNASELEAVEPPGYSEPEPVERPELFETEAVEPPEDSDAEVYLVEEIDRAISDTVEDPPARPDSEPSDEVDEADEDSDEERKGTTPKPGLKCPECGYTNDLSAWFCGVCGADIA
ncbi:MAG: hypothetical protein GEU90_03315 [Gemmatimonas sp.]|nr:hypothetical protein [Gemmatimonas sp.]